MQRNERYKIKINFRKKQELRNGQLMMKNVSQTVHTWITTYELQKVHLIVTNFCLFKVFLIKKIECDVGVVIKLRIKSRKHSDQDIAIRHYSDKCEPRQRVPKKLANCEYNGVQSDRFSHGASESACVPIISCVLLFYCQKLMPGKQSLIASKSC